MVVTKPQGRYVKGDGGDQGGYGRGAGVGYIDEPVFSFGYSRPSRPRRSVNSALPEPEKNYTIRARA